MNRHKRIWAIAGMAAACCVCLLVVLAVGCKEKARKPVAIPTAPKKQPPAATAPKKIPPAATAPKKIPPAVTAPKKIPPAATAPKPQAAAFVNDRCPVMSNNAIDPAKVTAKLTRTYKGKKVAFCCAACTVKWDKLTDAEKDAKLAKVMPAKGD